MGTKQIADFIKSDIGVADFGVRETFYLLEAEPQRLPATKSAAGGFPAATRCAIFGEKLKLDGLRQQLREALRERVS